jgi:hypothetical protein
MENDKITVEVKIGSKDWKLTGTIPMVRDMINDLEKKYEGKGSTNLSASVTVEPIIAKVHRKSKVNRTKAVNLDIPTVDQLMEYLLKQDRYEHDILSIEDVFWDRRVTARENQLLYRKLHDNLERARHKIEAITPGKFEQQLTSTKNLKKYVFKPLTQTLMQTLNGKTPTS